MTVTIIMDVPSTENNGTSVACMNLVRYLRSVGDEVRLVGCDEIKKDEPGYYYVPKCRFVPVIRGIVEKNDVAIAKPVNETIRKALDGADICHVMIPFFLAHRAAKIAREAGIPVTAGFHCQAENFTSHVQLMNIGLANKLFYKIIYRTFYRIINAIHYPTNFIRETFERECGHKTNGYVISNGVNDAYKYKPIKKPAELEGKFVILFIGRLAKEKSHKVLIKAVKKSKYKKDIQLVFAGTGPRKREVLACAKRCGIITPIIKFVPREELVNIINYSDLYCHPSEVEIEGIACLEAISCGKVPVISNSRRSATKEFAIDDHCLFECNRPKDLAGKIDFWIENEGLKKDYEQKYLRYADTFGLNSSMRHMREMLEAYALKREDGDEREKNSVLH